MRICDRCKDLKAPVLDLKLAILKPNPTTGRLALEEAQKADLELCDKCVVHVWTSLVDLTQKIRNEPPTANTGS